ncbi:MAG TPA: autotransporter domain-containing protein [Alphaproteobacteria bacterium]|nr:autotransporter domain-containing protein [Alphaproteobacteria bacterium]
MNIRRLFGHGFLVTTALAATSIAVPAQAQQIDRIVAFGDSYADEGNFFEILGFNPAPQVYPTGRFSGGTNYIDTLSLLLDVPVDNYAIGGALTNNTNTNGAGLPGFATEWNAFVSGNTLGGIFPAGGTFGEHDLVTVSIGGNDGRTYQTGNPSLGVLPGDVAGAPAAAAAAVAAAEVGLDALAGAGAQNISFLALNTSLAPEVAGDIPAQDIRNAYSAAFNAGIQGVLAGYAADGVIVHYLDLEQVAARINADPAAYGFTDTGACAPAQQCVTDGSYRNQFLFYVDNLHLTSAGFAVVAKYVAAQVQAPLTLEATSEIGLDTARQFGRTLSSRVDLGSPRDGEVAQGAHLFIVGDTFSRDLKADDTNDHFDVDGTGVTVGLSYGFPNGTVGIAGNYTRPKAKFIGDIARTESKTWQLGGFAGYAIAGAFAQGYLGYGNDDHDLTREGVIDSMSADTDGSHWLAGAKAGYLMPLGVFRAGPVVAIDYAKAKVDGYTEEGDAALTLHVDSVSAKSLAASIGAELRGDFDNSGISVRPFVSAMVEKELSNGHRTIRFAQTSAPGIVNRWTVGDGSKGVYGRLSGGGSAAILNGVSLNALASTTIGRDGGNDVSAQVGLDIGF